MAYYPLRPYNHKTLKARIWEKFLILAGWLRIWKN